MKQTKPVLLFLSRKLNNSMLQAIRADVVDVPDLVDGKYSRHVCTNAQNNMTQLRVFFSPKHMREVFFLFLLTFSPGLIFVLIACRTQTAAMRSSEAVSPPCLRGRSALKE